MSPPSGRAGAGERLERLLAVIPWVAAQDGPTIAEVCARFDVEEAQLVSDLETASLVGAWPRTPDELVEVIVEDDRVWVYFARSFARPLRLTPEEGLALLAAAAGVLARPGTDTEGPLASGLRKLAATLGIDPEQALDVELGRASPAILETLQTGARDHRQVEIDYYSYSRDERTLRTIDPLRVYADAGQWYVIGWCHQAGGERSFRVDRIHAARLLDETFEPREPETTGGYRAEPDDPRITMDLAPAAAWVVDRYPVERADIRRGGKLRVTLAVSGQAWLERLLLQLGPDATVVSTTKGLAAQPGADAARRTLARYGK